MTNNPSFPSPDPALPTVTTAIGALDAAQTAAQTRIRGAVATRNEKRRALVTLLEQLKGQVQKVADANPESAESIIQSAGLALRRPILRQKQAFAAKPGAVSGTVNLTAAAPSRRASYEWQYSLDGGKTWLTMPVTLQARATLSGLTPGATATFRVRAVTKSGEGDWSQPTALIVK
jgi:hypothetical protein